MRWKIDYVGWEVFNEATLKILYMRKKLLGNQAFVKLSFIVYLFILLVPNGWKLYLKQLLNYVVDRKGICSYSFSWLVLVKILK